MGSLISMIEESRWKNHSLGRRSRKVKCRSDADRAALRDKISNPTGFRHLAHVGLPSAAAASSGHQNSHSTKSSFSTASSAEDRSICAGNGIFMTATTYVNDENLKQINQSIALQIASITNEIRESFSMGEFGAYKKNSQPRTLLKPALEIQASSAARC